MDDGGNFTWLCDAIERATSLNRLEARGTVRLALKESGLEPKSLTAEQLGVVIARVLPQELRSRGISNAESVCQLLAEQAVELDLDSDLMGDSPEEVFRRLADR